MVGLALAGCGGSSSTSQTSTQADSTTQASSPQQTSASTAPPAGAQTAASGSKEHVPVNKLKLSSATFKEGSAIPAHYTCDGADTSPSVKWNEVPAGTSELIVFISDFEGVKLHGKEPLSWAVAGLHPTLKSLPPGTLPAGAIVGRNSFGQNRYSVCPPKGSGLQH